MGFLGVTITSKQGADILERVRKQIGNGPAGSGLADLLKNLGVDRPTEVLTDEPKTRKSSNGRPFMELFERLQSAAEVMVDGDFSSDAQAEIDALKGERDAATVATDHLRRESGAMANRVMELASKLGWTDIVTETKTPVHSAIAFLESAAKELRELGADCPAEDRRESAIQRIIRAARLGISVDPNELRMMRAELALVSTQVLDFAGDTLVAKVGAARVAVAESAKREALLNTAATDYRAQLGRLRVRMYKATRMDSESKSDPHANVERVMEKLCGITGMLQGDGWDELDRRLDVLFGAQNTLRHLFRHQTEPKSDMDEAVDA